MSKLRVLSPLCSLIAMLAIGASAQQIPPGTVLPVMVTTTLDGRDQPGKKINAQLMQEVPLPDGTKLSRGAKMVGHVVSSRPLTNGSPSALTVKFDGIEYKGKQVPLNIHLRALASSYEVYEARIPTNDWADYGTSPSDWNTVQIGGAGVYRGNGEVVSGNELVGKATDYGAVSGKLIPARDRGCAGASDRPQALWKFSPWACGVYGFNDVTIANTGKSDASGEITLESSRNLRIGGGSGWLLRVNSGGQSAPMRP